jgi:hypothetical protein
LVVAGAILVVIGGFPYLNAYRVTGNPVYPLFNAHFKAPYFPPLDLGDGRWAHKPAWDLLYDLTFRTHEFLEAQDGAFGFHYLALALAGIAGGFLRRDRLVIVATLVSLGYVLGTSRGILYARYLYPILPPLMLACTGILLLPGVRAVARGLTMVAGLALVALNLWFLPSGVAGLGTFDTQVLFSRGQRTAFIDRTAPIRRLIDVVNAAAGREANVLFVGHPFAAGIQGQCRMVFHYNYRFDARFEAITEPEAMFDLLRQEGVTHAIYSPGFPLANEAALKTVLAQHAKPLLLVNGVTLYKLDVPPAPPAPSLAAAP